MTWNARVRYARIGFQDHGILTVEVGLEYGDGSVQGFGAWNLDNAFCSVYVRKLLEATGVNWLHELVGRYVRVDIVDGRIERIGHILEDRWFCPRDERGV